MSVRRGTPHAANVRARHRRGHEASIRGPSALWRRCSVSVAATLHKERALCEPRIGMRRRSASVQRTRNTAQRASIVDSPRNAQRTNDFGSCRIARLLEYRLCILAQNR
jgi:hypothetical protein